ncbi:MAG: PspC domain-containing protein [Thermaurantimonas sp.]
MNDTVLLGVCSWLARRFDLDIRGVRIAFIIGTLLSFGTAILAYLILALVKPKYE